MKHKLMMACLLLSAVGLSAQQSQESLVIGPGDMLSVQVFDTPELTQHTRVNDAGNISLITGGDVKVAGLAADQAAHAIENALLEEHILLKPRVLVSVDEYATEKVTILGEVKVPGAYTIRTPRPVLEVLVLAGGLNDLADRKILIQRHGSSEKIPYFVSNKPDVALDSEVKVNPGDSILVPRAGIVYALGDVKAAGGYTMTDNRGQLTVLELVARAGGENHTAASAHTRLIRKSGDGYVEIALPLKDMFAGKRADFALQPDDIIYIPFSYVRNLAINGAAIVATAGNAAVYRF